MPRFKVKPRCFKDLRKDKPGNRPPNSATTPASRVLALPAARIGAEDAAFQDIDSHGGLPYLPQASLILARMAWAGMRPVAAAETMLPATPGPSPATYTPPMRVSRLLVVSIWVAKNFISGV